MDEELFKTAPKEVTRYFAAKAVVPSFDWRDIAPEEHAFSFTVAKSVGYDILDDFKRAVGEAIKNRLPFQDFQKNLMPLLQEKGWWGRKSVLDPQSGEKSVVELGSPRRLETVYWANTMSAHAAGEWERTQNNKEFLPYLTYALSSSEHKRLEHESWVGFTAPVDDPVWDWLYPPNGWRCKCSVRQVSRYEAENLGYEEDAAPFQVEQKVWHNKRTGKVEKIPKGIDPGWNSNPGKHRAQNLSRFLSDKIFGMPEERKRIAIEDIVGSPLLQAMFEERLPRGFLPIAPMTRKVCEVFATDSSFVRLSSDSVKHILLEHQARDLTLDDFRGAIQTLIRPHGIIRRKDVPSILFFGEGAGAWWRLAVKFVASKQEWWLISMHKKSFREIQRLLNAAEEKGERLL
ncbi:phage head morphogenesis protein [Bartonella harrusi]|uniref:Phage minor head protein n=1 Tax=Bartonella harrusi TaxID=2961895 RepID=A0ABY5EYJ7_9HYPH|nr:phage minor head protein [Bartonella harrusi]UTO29303.1 phage minor head protein [Bartonella harrusi]